MTTFYHLNRQDMNSRVVNNGCMALFEKRSYGLVDECIVQYSNSHSKKETYLYNNRLYFGIINPSQANKDQYDINWKFINGLK